MTENTKQGFEQPQTAQISWSGSFPQNYEDNLKFIFGPYAEDLAGRAEVTKQTEILELACGTGQVTQQLLARFGNDLTITATDLSPDMLAIAIEKLRGANVVWNTVDMCAIPYEDEKFDLVICQFGIMFAPDKSKALQEMRRVLKPGGKLLFSTWGLLGKNRIFEIFNETLISSMNFDMAAAEQGPFAMQDEQEVLKLLRAAGFKNADVEAVSKTGESPSAAQAAKGFFQGSQLAANLKEKNPVLGEKIQAAAQQSFIRQLGDNPMQTPLQAWVFEAFKS